MQALALYAVKPIEFPELQVSDGKNRQVLDTCRHSELFQGTFMALEHILLKSTKESEHILIKEIFVPELRLGQSPYNGQDYDSLTEQQLNELFDSVYNLIPYIEPARVKDIYQVLGRLTQEDIALNFCAQEFNDQGIYPSGAWHTDGGEDEIFNQQHIVTEFTVLSQFFQQAANEQMYVISLMDF